MKTFSSNNKFLLPIIALVLPLLLTACSDGRRDHYDVDVYLDGRYLPYGSDVVEGSEIKVCWSASDYDDTGGDYIGLYEVGAGDSFYLAYSSTYGDKEGCLNFSITDPGEYEFRYIQPYYYYAAAAHSQRFSVVRGEYVLGLSATDINIGDRITVYWDAPPYADLSRDWIGLYYVLNQNTETLIDSVYVSSRERFETWTMNDYGFYKFVYFKNGTSEAVGESEVFMVRVP